jgi:hypothetical protein
LEIFAGGLRRRRFFRVAKKESWRASPLLAKDRPREQAIHSVSEFDRHQVANCCCRNEVFSNVFVAFRYVRGQLSADGAEQ